jgi:hypothetical protein
MILGKLCCLQAEIVCLRCLELPLSIRANSQTQDPNSASNYIENKYIR